MIDLPTFPMLAYHPIHGAVSFYDYDSAVKTMTVRTDWFKTKEEADAHRHEGEAAQREPSDKLHRYSPRFSGRPLSSGRRP